MGQQSRHRLGEDYGSRGKICSAQLFHVIDVVLPDAKDLGICAFEQAMVHLVHCEIWKVYSVLLKLATALLLSAPSTLVKRLAT